MQNKNVKWRVEFNNDNEIGIRRATTQNLRYNLKNNNKNLKKNFKKIFI